MPSLPFLYTDFHGGLNTKSAPYLLEDNQARDLLNVQGTTSGAIVKRRGLVTLASPAVVFDSLFALEETALPFLIGAGSTFLYSVSTAGTVVQRKSGLTTGLPWEFVQAPATGGQGPLWGMNGTDTPQQWDGVAGTTSAWTASSGAVPNGKYCIVHANRTWVAGTNANPSRLYFSGIGDPRAWPAQNVVDLDPNDGEPITGIGLVGPYLLVGKRHKLFVVYDSDTGANRRISALVGVASHRSIANAPEGTYFLAEDRGVYTTNGTKVTPISDNLQPTIDSITASVRANAAGVFHQGHYYLSFASHGSTTNSQTLDWDSTLNSWWLHSFGSNQFALWHPVDQGNLYSAKATSAIVDQCFVPSVTTDNGSPMTWVWRGPWQSPTFYRRRRFPTPYFRKRLRQIRIDGAGTVDVSLAKNFAGQETLLQSNVFGAGSGDGTFAGAGSYADADGTVFGGTPTAGLARIHSLGVARAFSLVMGCTSSSADMVTSYVLMITDRRDLVVS